MLAEKTISSYVVQVWDSDLPASVRGFIEDELDPRFGIRKKDDMELRLTPPGNLGTRTMTYIPSAASSEVLTLEKERRERYGRPLTDTVGELPASVRARYAIPAIVRNVLRQLEEGKTLDELRSTDFFHLGAWKIQMV
jgi:hypothetical protein